MTRRGIPRDSLPVLDALSSDGSMFHRMEQTPTERTAGAVRAELARRKISGRDLAASLGWSVTTTWRRLNGTTAFDVEELATVAEHLGVPVSTFLPEREPAA